MNLIQVLAENFSQLIEIKNQNPIKFEALIKQLNICNKYDLEINRYKQGCQKFVDIMNYEAKKIGMINTNFANVTGLCNPQNKSSSFDLAKLSSKCLKNQLFNKIINTKEYQYSIRDFNGNYRVKIWKNTNKLLDMGCQGIKTGITDNVIYIKHFKNQYIITCDEF